MLMLGLDLVFKLLLCSLCRERQGYYVHARPRQQLVTISGSHHLADDFRIRKTDMMCSKPLQACKVMHAPLCEMEAFVGHPQSAVQTVHLG